MLWFQDSTKQDLDPSLQIPGEGGTWASSLTAEAGCSQQAFVHTEKGPEEAGCRHPAVGLQGSESLVLVSSGVLRDGRLFPKRC